MKLLMTDYNGADALCTTTFAAEWADVQAALTAMPLHLKASDQAGKQGQPIFDPVGTNEAINTDLVAKGWSPKIPIPAQWNFLGTDVDFGKNGVIVEAQFSNYPFLLNNILRTELFVKSKTALPTVPTQVLVLVTKAHMFPASNSTLYYEQAKNQLDALAKNNVFDAPVRLVGLSADRGTVPCVYTDYSSARYSRTVKQRETTTCTISNGRGANSRCQIVVQKAKP